MIILKIRLERYKKNTRARTARTNALHAEPLAWYFQTRLGSRIAILGFRQGSRLGSRLGARLGSRLTILGFILHCLLVGERQQKLDFATQPQIDHPRFPPRYPHLPS